LPHPVRYERPVGVRTRCIAGRDGLAFGAMAITRVIITVLDVLHLAYGLVQMRPRTQRLTARDCGRARRHDYGEYARGWCGVVGVVTLGAESLAEILCEDRRPSGNARACVGDFRAGKSSPRG
jgi:hypothetical protein